MSPWEAVRLAAPDLAVDYAELLSGVPASSGEGHRGGIRSGLYFSCDATGVSVSADIDCRADDTVRLTWGQVNRLIHDHLSLDQVSQVRRHYARWRKVWGAYCERLTFDASRTTAEEILQSRRNWPFYRAGTNAHRVMRDYTRDAVLTAPTEPIDADAMGTPSLFGALA